MVTIPLRPQSAGNPLDNISNLFPFQQTGTNETVAGSGGTSFAFHAPAKGPTTSIPYRSFSGIETDYEIQQGGGVSVIGDVFSFAGASNLGHILTPSQFQTTVTGFVFSGPSTLPGTAFLQGVVGTSGTAEKYFDRSPFFFTPSEIDPNTLRDIREVEPFLVFSTAVISSFDSINNTSNSTSVIKSKDNNFPIFSPVSIAHLGKTNSSNEILTFPPSLLFVVGSGGIIDTPTATGTTAILEGPISLQASDDVTAIDLTGPFFDERDPDQDTTFNDPATQVEFHIKDANSDLDPGTIDVFIDGEQVVSASVVQSTATWPTGNKTEISDRDFEYVFTRSSDFDSGVTVVVSGTFEDDEGNATDDNYTFQIRGQGDIGVTITGSPDIDPPIISPINPVDLQTGVSANTHLIFNVFDEATGVDPSATKFIVNGATVFSGTNVFEGSLSRTGDSDIGFRYDFTPASQFVFGSTVTGTVEAQDLVASGSPNFASLTYEFTITPSDSLEIKNFFLSANESTLLTSGTLISVEVIDPIFGVNSSATTLTINDSVPTGLSTVILSSGIRFEIPAQPIVNFREDLEVFVHAENSFPGDFPQIEEASFLLRPGYDVDWPNRLVLGPEKKFPFLTNIDVLVDVKNFAKNFAQQTEFFRFFTENLSNSNLGATLESNIKTADLSAVIDSVNPFFEFGKTIVLEIEADDLDGNQLRFTHTFVIESKPN